MYLLSQENKKKLKSDRTQLHTHTNLIPGTVAALK